VRGSYARIARNPSRDAGRLEEWSGSGYPAGRRQPVAVRRSDLGYLSHVV